MKLKRFRIQMFKGVIDSGFVDIENLTVLVGKNEAGKTTLLKGLHKLNPAHAAPYNINREWPRGLRNRRSADQFVSIGVFELDQKEAEELSRLTDQKFSGKSVEVTRNYANHLEVIFLYGVFPNRVHPNEVDRLCNDLPILPLTISDGFRRAAEKAHSEIRRLAGEGLFSELANAAANQSAVLSDAISSTEPQATHEREYQTQYVAKVADLAARIPKDSMQAKAHEYVVNALPRFIYMDDYRTFEGAAILNQVKERRDGKNSTDEDETFLMILTQAGLNLDSLVKAGDEKDRENRQYDLDDGGRTLTSVFKQRLKQREYEVQFRADGQEFFTMVKDKTETGLLRLDERSKGFQWFFSFDMLFMHESKGKFENCVILLDEPGLHLHPGAQADLLARLEEYGRGNTLIYSTHLPFMIDLRHPERIRVINESPEGARVSEDLTETQADAKLTLQAALGMSGRSSYLLAQRNIVVEGADDFMVLSALSEILIRSGLEGLPEDVMITAAGGASEAAYIATFMIGQKLDVVVLLDSDGAGETARDKLVKNWLTRYKGKESQVLCLGDIVGDGVSEFAVEDLFSDEFYWARVKDVYAKQLLAAAGAELSVVGTGQICKRIERALESKSIKFNKGSVAKRIRGDLTRMKHADDLPPETVKKAKELFAALNKALA